LDGRQAGGPCFQMKNVNFLRAARKTEGQAGGLHKKAVKRAAEKGGEAAENGGPEGCSAY